MNLKNQPPVFVPDEVRAEIEQLSKAALMDMVWDYAVQLTGDAAPGHLATHGPGATGAAVETALKEFRTRREVVLLHRQLVKEQAEAA